MIRVALLLISLLTPLPALAHNVIADVYATGTDIEGEIGFSDGTMSANELVEVFNETGQKIGETITDADGFFVFTPTQPVTHVFRANLGAGHIAQAQISTTEVARIIGKTADPTPSATPASDATPPRDTQLAGLSDKSRAEIATMLRDELRPIRQELTAYKNKTNFQSVLGGLGYIFGLFGLGFYLMARRKIKDNT
jgi:nickel transport protein